MKLASLLAVLAFGLLTAVAPAPASTTASADDAPINAMCPIGKEAIVPSAGTVSYRGHTIGLCCPSCGKAFLAWDGARRDAFVELALRGAEPGQAQPEAAPARTAADPGIVAPYPLDVCVISGGKLGSMGDPIVKKYDGREVRFCCGGCVGRFEADRVAGFKKIDTLIARDQLRYYPTQRCVVSGEPLIEDGKDTAVTLVHQERLVRLCCRMCEKKFKADPAKYMKKLDDEVRLSQGKQYPLKECVVAGSPLGSMGAPTEMIVAGRLLRFCCAGCEPKVKTNPTKYIAAVDKGWERVGLFKPAPKAPTADK